MTAIITETHIQRRRLVVKNPRPDSGKLFLVGGGVSLAKTPMGLLIGEECWATEGVEKCYDWTFWRPARYWAAAEPKSVNEKDNILFHLNQGYDCWVASSIAAHLSTREANLTIWEDSFIRTTYPLKYLARGELNLATLVKAAVDSTYDEVYLVGVDDEPSEGLLLALRMLTIKEKSVYNLTIGGDFEEFPRRTFADVPLG